MNLQQMVKNQHRKTLSAIRKVSFFVHEKKTENRIYQLHLDSSNESIAINIYGIVMSPCPRRSEMILAACTPWLMSNVADVCFRSWKRI